MIRRIRLFESSSAKLAFLFSGLLGFAAILLVVETIAIAQHDILPAGYSTLVLGLLFLVCASLFVISYYVTKRINIIVQTANNIIATGDVSQRIPLDARWDDLSKLSLTLNAMLDKIDLSVSGMRTLSDNIAHDMRHPLTRMRNHIETMREHADSLTPQETSQRLGELTSECDALLSTFQALLRISNIEVGHRQSEMVAIDLAQLLADAVELYEPVAIEKSVTISQQVKPVEIHGDKDLLFQAFANLIDNAIKYTPAGGSITVEAEPIEHHVCITIRDTGTGVGDEHKPRLFNRFYRVEHSRSTPGNGLGLCLVAAIIKMHHGSIGLHDNQPAGLAVVMELPRKMHHTKPLH